MNSAYTVKLSEIVKEHGLTVVHSASCHKDCVINTIEVNRPGLQLSGFYDYFDHNRVQIIGKVETTYLETLPSPERAERFARLMSQGIQILIVCHGIEPMPECVEMARRYDVNLLRTDIPTSLYLAQLATTLQVKLAPRCTLHGVLVEVHGEGLLITGESGIGKSETAVELIKRGHRLVADDAVEIRRGPENTLSGAAPEMIKYYMELRGIGIIDARRIFGVGAVKPSCSIDLVVHFENWDQDKIYDRLGIETIYTDILGVSVPIFTVPVRPGRNLAVILEMAAMNNRQKNMGHNAAEILANDHDRYIYGESL